MTSVEINNVSGDSFPCSVYVCTIYNTECVEIGTIPISPSFPISFNLPSQYIYAPVILLRIVCSECENFEILYCS
jgi:hypothetical protein